MSLCLLISDNNTRVPVIVALNKEHMDMTSFFATPDPDLEDQQVIGEIHETRASLADYLRGTSV